MASPRFLEWMALAGRFRFDTAFRRDATPAALLALAIQGISTSGDLVEIPSADALALLQLALSSGVLVGRACECDLWRNCCTPDLDPGVVSRGSFLRKIKRNTNQSERPGRIQVRARGKLRAPAYYPRMGPA